MNNLESLRERKESYALALFRAIGRSDQDFYRLYYHGKDRPRACQLFADAGQGGLRNARSGREAGAESVSIVDAAAVSNSMPLS